MKVILERQWSSKRSCYEIETVMKFTYFGDRVSAGGQCEAVGTDRIRCGWDKFMK